MVQQTDSQLPPLPPELYAGIEDLHPKSHEFSETLLAANDLARLGGYALLTVEDIHPPRELTPPLGFSSETVLPNGLVLPISQFEGRIFSLKPSDDITVEAHRLTADGSRKSINLCDLRPSMTSSVRKGGPKTTAEVNSLDRAFFRDLKFYLESGHAMNPVTGARGVFYTMLGDKMDRAYWMPVTVESANGTTTIARIADCANSKSSEGNLYNRVFKQEL